MPKGHHVKLFCWAVLLNEMNNKKKQPNSQTNMLTNLKTYEIFIKKYYFMLHASVELSKWLWWSCSAVTASDLAPTNPNLYPRMCMYVCVWICFLSPFWFPLQMLFRLKYFFCRASKQTKNVCQLYSLSSFSIVFLFFCCFFCFYNYCRSTDAVFLQQFAAVSCCCCGSVAW